MTETLLYLVSSFWLGGIHAVTPGHGKTIAAAYIVGLRGRPVDALVLGIFVTLSHTFGIVLVAVLASLGSAWAVPQQIEAYLAVGTGVLVIGIGLWMLWTQWGMLCAASRPHEHVHPAEGHGHHHDHGQEHSHERQYAYLHAQQHNHDHERDHSHSHHDHEHHLREFEPVYHRHGWGPSHTHDIETFTKKRPSLLILLWLAIAGGLLPDPAALAILLAAIASGKLILGLFTVIVFSLGFASVLVIVAVVAAQVGEIVFTWLSSRKILWFQISVSLVIIGMGIFLTANAWRVLS